MGASRRFSRSHACWESFQFLAVCWFAFILASSPRWSRAFILGQLLAAGSFAILMKATTPGYCLFLGLASLIYVVKSDRPWGLRDTKAKLVLGFAFVLVLAVMFWYRSREHLAGSAAAETSLSHHQRSCRLSQPQDFHQPLDGPR